MSWLRIDDGFAQHPKVIQLVAKDRWTWLEVLCYCARYRTDGFVPDAIGQVVRGATAQFLGRCYELELLDLSRDGDGGYVVHDWSDFNPPRDAAERKRDSRMSQRDRDIGVTSAGQKRDRIRDSRVGARARSRPVPSPDSSTCAVEVANSTGIADKIEASLGAVA